MFFLKRKEIQFKDIFKAFDQETKDFIVNESLNVYKFIGDNLKRDLKNVTILTDKGDAEHGNSSLILASIFYHALQPMYHTKLIVEEKPLTKKDESKEFISVLKYASKDDLVVLCVTNKIGNLKSLTKSFRKYMADKNSSFYSMMGLGNIKKEKIKDYLQLIYYDQNDYLKDAERIMKFIRDGSEMVIKSKNGSNLVIPIKETEPLLNSPMIDEKRSGGNLPHGEVYIPVKKGKASGELVIDGAMNVDNKLIILDEPLKLNIKLGEITSMEGKYADEVDKAFKKIAKMVKYPQNIKLVSEFGIGLNKKAKLGDNNTINEKTYGASHIAVGSNKWLGGDITSSFHWDFVFKNPEIYIDGLLIWSAEYKEY